MKYATKIISNRLITSFVLFFRIKIFGVFFFWFFLLKSLGKKNNQTNKTEPTKFSYSSLIPQKNRICSPESLLKGHLDICKGKYLEMWMQLFAFSKSEISQLWEMAIGAVQNTEPRMDSLYPGVCGRGWSRQMRTRQRDREETRKEA